MTRVSINNKPKCYIHPRRPEEFKEIIRKKVCQDLKAKHKYEGKNYCVLHYPHPEKHESTDFEDVVRDRLEKQENIFDYVFFSSAFSLKHNYVFHKVAEFNFATFAGYASFHSVKFEENAGFINTKFNSVNFDKATFVKNAYFFQATFNYSASFESTIFSEKADFGSVTIDEKSKLLFQNTIFQKFVDFNEADIKGFVLFNGERKKDVFVGSEVVLDLQNAHIDKPERISFHTVRLRPTWFVNVDCRKFIFTDCRWRKESGEDVDVKSELQSLADRKFPSSNYLLTKTCWQLAENYEEIKAFLRASTFRKMANESLRLNKLNRKNKFLSFLHWWYWFSSDYGEDPRKAAWVLGGVILLFALLYWSPLSSFDYGEKKERTVVAQDIVEKQIYETAENAERFHSMDLGEGFVHSLYIATFQRPEPKAADTWTRLFIILETIFAPLQAALLALAIRRKFMR